MKSKISRKKEITKIRTVINEIEIRKKSNFFEKINKIHKSLVRLKRQKEIMNTQIKREVTPDTTEIQRGVLIVAQR